MTPPVDDVARPTSALDPRLTPARGDVAAAHLRGVVEAQRFVEATPFQVTAGVAALRRDPQGGAEMVGQQRLGEAFDVYDEREGWGWGQTRADGYVGYVEMDALSAPVLAPDLKLTALRSYVFSAPDIRSAPRFLVSLNSRFTQERREGDFIHVARAGWIAAVHLAPLTHRAPDWVAVAERFLGAPYLWGGKESLGLDCSGLIQMALAAAGIDAPRDTDMQEAMVGVEADIAAPRRRGDLVFWRGHVGVMVDGTRLLHANGTWMETVLEPLEDVAARMAPKEGPITSVRHVPPTPAA